jgi:hypothetical protein
MSGLDPHAPLAFGRRLLFREVERGHWVPILGIVVIVLLVRFWSPLLERIGAWWRAR